jgi:uncharacterized protein (TIGR03435 family)
MRLIFACFPAVAALFAQDAAPAFDVVSVKAAGPVFTPAAPGERAYSNARGFRYTGGSMTARETIKHMIQEAFNIEDWAVEGPGWFNDEVFDIQARMPPDTSRDTARSMLRTMLIQRFGLTYHMAKRDIAIYALIIGKQGFKLRPADDNPRPGFEMHDDKYLATGTMDGVSATSRSYADKPVVNMTGIEGIYHFELRWPFDSDADSRDKSARFWSALEKETGLCRELRKAPHDVIVVDHVERVPTAN